MAEKSPSRQLARTLDSGRFYVQVDLFCKQSVGESRSAEPAQSAGHDGELTVLLGCGRNFATLRNSVRMVGPNSEIPSPFS